MWVEGEILRRMTEPAFAKAACISPGTTKSESVGPKGVQVKQTSQSNQIACPQDVDTPADMSPSHVEVPPIPAALIPEVRCGVCMYV
jgi:hypothetical protein